MKSKIKVEGEDEYNPERMQRLPRGSFRERHPDYDPATAEKKVRVTIYLDADVLDYFKRRAAVPNAAGYQTQINAELRAVMEPGGSAPYDALLSDERFIEAVAARVRQRA